MEKKLYDDAFYVEEKRWGTWQSHYPDGAGIITSLTEEQCLKSTRWYLKAKFEKSIDENSKSYQGSMDYKL
jgi:hypothetical protein